MCVYICYAKPEEIMHSQKRQNCDEFKTHPDGNFWLAVEDVRENGAFGSLVTREVLVTYSCYFFRVK